MSIEELKDKLLDLIYREIGFYYWDKVLKFTFETYITDAIIGGTFEIFPKVLTCIDCKHEFYLTMNEQIFYNKRGLKEPKRCPDCRVKRKNNK